MLQYSVVKWSSVRLHLSTSLSTIGWVPAQLEHISCWVPPYEILDTALVHHDGM